MSIQNTSIFGFPLINTRIDKKSYNKKNIISNIEKNFNINNFRNNWDNESVLHHSNNDWDNEKFNKINFETLIPIYKKIIINIFNELKIVSNFEFKIVNYTCLSNTNYMSPHIHSDSDFSAIHYIQFDKKNHKGTTFVNTSPYVDYIKKLAPHLFEKLSSKNIQNSWLFGTWLNEVKEDDFYFYPSYLKHKIDPQISKDKKRITIALNINLIKKEDKDVY
tara:strand:+ start:8364 stop:9023 length:660 start_codon:yes stop_codon:yes gene_type:complete